MVYISVKNDKEVNYIFYSKSNSFAESVEEFSPIRRKMNNGEYTQTWYSKQKLKKDNLTENIIEIFGIKSSEDELDELLEEIYKERTKT